MIEKNIGPCVKVSMHDTNVEWILTNSMKEFSCKGKEERSKMCESEYV